MIEARAYARAGLLGNPSDGYNGRTISISVRDFEARVTLVDSATLRIEPTDEDRDEFAGVNDLVERIDRLGYYGGARLVKAVIRKFAAWCAAAGVDIPERNCTIRYATTIPRQVGLAGSSAIATAAMRGLMGFYGIDIPIEAQPCLTLEAEKDELGITGGLQDRVIQVYEGCVSMNFDAAVLEREGQGAYERLDAGLLPELYIAYKTELGKVSGQVLGGIRDRYDKGERLVVDTLAEIAALAAAGREAIVAGDTSRLHDLMNRNFDLRARIMTITESNRELIETARSCGASAKFCGSGGSIIGILPEGDDFARLTSSMNAIGATVIRPSII
jgi:glucuronokinase